MSAPAAPTPSPRPAASSAPTARGGGRAPTIDPVRILRQHAKLFAITLGCGLVLGAVVHFGSLFLYPIYSGQVLFELNPQLVDPTDIVGQDTTQEETVSRLAQTEAARIMSRNVLTEACKNRDIEETVWAKWFVDDTGGFLIDEAVDELEEDMGAGHRRGTQLFYLGWSTHDADDVPVVLNTVASTYLRLRNQDDELRYSGTHEVFQKQLDAIDQNLGTLRREIQDFIQSNQIPAFEENSLQSQKGLEELMLRLSETVRDLTLQKARREMLVQKINGEVRPGDEDRRQAEQHPAIMQLRRDAEDGKSNLEHAQRRFGDDHPAVIAAKERASGSQGRYDAELELAITKHLNAEYKTTLDTVVGLESLLVKQNGDYTAEAERLEKLAAAVAELESKKDRMAQLQEDRASIQQRLGELDVIKLREDARRVRIVQESLRPRELTFPQPEFVIPGVAMLLLATVVGIVFTREMLDQRVRSAADLGGVAGGRVLGVIPDIADDPTTPDSIELISRLAPQSPVAESLRQLSASFSRVLAERGLRTVAVLPTMPQSGATSVTVNLAAAAAAVGRRVLVIDANLRRPTLATAAGATEDQTGLAECLTGATTLAAAVQGTTAGFWVLSAGAPAERVVERLYGEGLDKLLAEARAAYDLVLIDTAPSMVANESLVIANRVDATVVVVRAMQDQRGLVAKVAGQIQDTRGQFLGLILNRQRSTAGGYLQKNLEAMAEYTAPAKA